MDNNIGLGRTPQEAIESLRRARIEPPVPEEVPTEPIRTPQPFNLERLKGLLPGVGGISSAPEHLVPPRLTRMLRPGERIVQEYPGMVAFGKGRQLELSPAWISQLQTGLHRFIGIGTTGRFLSKPIGPSIERAPEVAEEI